MYHIIFILGWDGTTFLKKIPEFFFPFMHIKWLRTTGTGPKRQRDPSPRDFIFIFIKEFQVILTFHKATQNDLS